MTRKATDVLLDIEKDVKEILGTVKNNTLLLSNLANRISKLEKGGVSVAANPTSDPVVQEEPQEPVKRMMPGLKGGVSLNNGVLSKEDGMMPGLKGKKKASKKKASARGNQHKGTPVQQKVQYPDGKPVANANVEITLNGEIVYKTKTNATGKWTGGVKSGVYNINVYKKGTSRRPEVNIETSISIVDQSEPLQLDNLRMEE